MCAFQNQAHRRGAKVAERSILLIQSRHKRRSGDWIENAIPAYRQAGLREEDRGLLKVVEPITKVALRGRKSFGLAVSPAKQKKLSLRPRRLCGENSILDKHT